MTTPTRAERDEMRALLAKGRLPWRYEQEDDGQWRIAPGIMLIDGTSGTPDGDELDVEKARLLERMTETFPALLDALDRAEAENNITRDNMRSVWAALGRVREAVEAICLPGTVPQAHEVDGFPEPVAEAMTLSSAIAARVETAEATIARLTAEVTEEEANELFHLIYGGYADSFDPDQFKYISELREGLTAFLASRKGGRVEGEETGR